MGKKKIQTVELIDDVSQRNVTYCKRKKGLIKKAMEVSLLCGQQVLLAIYDEQKSKLVLYESSNSFNTKKVDFL